MTNEETSNKPPHREMHDVHRNRMAWISDGHFEAVEDFNFDAVDANLLQTIAAEPDDVKELAGDLLSRVMVWVLSPTTTRASLVRFAADSAGLRPDLMADKTFKQLGAELGVTRASVSKAATKFQKAFSFRFSRGRSAEACEHMAEAQRGHGNYHHKARR